ncbi:hypothetical protein D1007_42475 [Hordeum vulgare]|uniref:Predicted protein n=1 Tax=Hordeum vulgare subsp. vulgare TaxID=112509 RepID=F2EBL0_HORVV|nr:hypothetical protein D1007_42475 [Hordeum vulgare]BAK04732.1 predicted protein [Hordeum vulgare subsp. vulgare]
MGTAAKPPPFVCFKWPWGPSLNASPGPSAGPSPCGDLERPWLFKSICTIAQGLVITGDTPSASTVTGGYGAKLWKRHAGTAPVEADRGDAEQRALAATLVSSRATTVLEFYSPRCRLCSSLQGLVRELEGGGNACASFVLADAEDDRWLPEVRASPPVRADCVAIHIL